MSETRTASVPFNTELRAHNAFEHAVDLSIIDELSALYERHVLPRIDQEEGVVPAGELTFNIVYPRLAFPQLAWSSDVKWWSPDDLSTFAYLESIFARMGIAERFAQLVDVDRNIRLYAPFFVTRTWCESTFFHTDWDAECGTNAYTFMTPLADYRPTETGQLVYRDELGRDQVYVYRRGTALTFGSSFWHGTQTVARGAPRAFLCFTFGSDKREHWPAIKHSVDHQSRLYCAADGTFVRAEEAALNAQFARQTSGGTTI